MSSSQITLPIISPYPPPPLPSAKSVPVLWRNGSVALSFIVLPQPFGNTNNHNESSLQLSSQKSLLCRKGEETTNRGSREREEHAWIRDVAGKFRTRSCILLARMFQRGKKECSYSKNIRPRAYIRNCTMKREFRVLDTRTREKFRPLLYRGRMPLFSQACPLLLRRFCTHP